MVLSRIDWRWFGLKALAHALALAPAAVLFWRAWHDGLGADPVAALTHGTGEWALRLLLLGLALTPLRQLLKRPWPIRFRRLLGLYAFFYASLHLTVYLLLDLGSYWSQIGADILKRPFITVGFAAWLLLVPLALTSTQAMMRRLKKNWQRLHRLVYAIAVLAVLHFWWLVKSDIREPLAYAAVLAVLLGWRVSYRRKAAAVADARPQP